MKKLLLLLLLASCNIENDWGEALAEHKCTEAQYSRAVKEGKECKENSDYSGSYCLQTAVLRICDKLNK